jgi:hypothetical protein
MSEHTVAKNRSRRAPASAAGTVAPREEEEEVVSEAAAISVDPKSTLSYRLALGAVIFLGVLIVVGIGVLVVGLVKGWGQAKAPAAAAQPKPVSMGLEPGYRILSSDTQPGRLILHVRSDTADEIFVIDLNDGHIVATIHGDAPKQ